MFLPSSSLSPKHSIGKGILCVISTTHASGVPAIVGAGENDESASVLSSFPLSCLHIEQGAELQSYERDRKSLTSGVTYLSPQYTDKGEKYLVIFERVTDIMASKTDKPYTYHKSGRLAIICEDIKKLISDTSRKKRDNLEPQTCEQSLKPPPLTLYTVDVLKPEEHSPLTTWEFESPPMTEANWKKVQPQIHDILAFTQTLGYLHYVHPKDIQLLLEATTTFYLWHTTIPFKSKDLEPTMVLAECLKRPQILQLTELHWVLKEWVDNMSFMLCGRHLLVPVAPGQVEDPPIPKRLKG